MNTILSKKNISILSGPVLFLFLQYTNPDGIDENAFDILCITIWMALWWITEVVPIAVTALLPIVLFPLTGALDISATTAAYGHKYVFLFLGGFILAIAIEKWNLHKRIALTIISIIGNKIKNIILGFMIATAFISMWISNTATSVMMLPIGMAVISILKDDRTTKKEQDLFGKALMLAIAYSASIGGMATLIGTPPNLIFAGILEELYGVEIGFMNWMLVGFPIAVILTFLAWWYLTNIGFKFKNTELPGGRTEIKKLLQELGEISKQEKRVLVVFVCTAFLWMTRTFLIQPIIPAIDDTIIAMIAGLVLFVIPAGNVDKKGLKSNNRALITWKEAVKLPWGIILLFGGGMALAKGFEETGLAFWIADQLVNLQFLPLFILVIFMVAGVNLLSEVASNTATTAMLLPVLAPLAVALGVHPYLLLVGGTLAASCGFMLPAATPPNAIVFGSGQLKISDMVKAGIWMDLIAICLISIFVYFYLPFIWDFNLTEVPKIFSVN